MSNTIKISSTLQAAHKIKQNLEDQIRCITNQPEIFAQFPTDFFGKFDKPVGSFHLNALYDPLNKYYASVNFQKIRQLDERSSLCKMVDEFTFEKPTIIIADRGHESFNVYEHIRKSGQKFVIRVKDTRSNGFRKGFGLPQKGTFDKEVNL